MKTLIKFLTALLILQSCTKEKCTEIYDGITYTPIYASMASLRTVNIQPAKALTSNGKIFVKGNYIFMNEVDKGFHIIDNTNPTNPQRIAFVSIPGNMDMIAKGNFLLVDNYVDLLTFNISNPANIQLVKRTENALPFRQYNYGLADDLNKGIIVSFDKKMEKMEMDCNSSGNFRMNNGNVFLLSATAASSPTKSLGGINGQAGSLSRFATVNNYLYVANRYSITPIDITNVNNPLVKPIISTGEIETLYGFNNSLLVGSPIGMFIYALTDPAVPVYLSSFSHWRGCDPVVAQNNIAYVTVRASGPCGGNRNILDVLDISNLNQPVLIKNYQLENPFGLGIYNNKLGICDGKAGFKLYNASAGNNLILQNTVSNINAFDVIMNNEIALLIAKDGMYQYNITNSSSPVLLSKISIVQ